jgi:methyltransferase-like protein
MGAHDIIQMEQYMDFVRCRYFRKTLICHSGVPLTRTITPAVVGDLFLASDAAPTPADAPLDPATTVSFQNSAGNKITCRSPVTKIALRILRSAWPLPVPFKTLLENCKSEAAAAGHPADDATVGDFLAGEMLTSMAAGLIEWRLTPEQFTTTVGSTPATTPLARLQAKDGYRVTNLRGELVTLDEIHRQTVKLLDGARGIDKLIEGLMASLARGELVLQRDTDKSQVTDEGEMRTLLRPALEKVLKNLAAKALLKSQST